MLVAAACVALAGAGRADDDIHPLIVDKYFVQLGAYLPSKELTLSVAGSVEGGGQEFDFEKSIGGRASDELFEVELAWRFGEKWSLRGQHYSSNRTRRTVLEEDITWRDTTILAGSSVTAGSDFSMSRLFFGRSLDARTNTDAGIGMGIHWLEIGAFINPDIIVASADVSAASVSGPLPNIGGWYYWSPTQKWFFGGRVDWFEASVGKYDGGIMNISAGVNYQLFKHVGIGLKYQAFDLAVDIDDNNWNGRVELTYDGPYVYLSGSW